MTFDPLDRTNESTLEPATDEFEKLEFLPEQPASADQPPDDTSSIDFTPDAPVVEEPPVSFSPVAGDELDTNFDTLETPDLAASTPFELFGTSLFDADLDEDLDDLGTDDDFDLEF